MIVNQSLRIGIATLNDAKIPNAPRDARRLMAFALGVAPDRITLVSGDDITRQQQLKFTTAIDARCTGQPVAQITGSRLFFGREYLVTPDVLDPRPETEILVTAALEKPFLRVLDLGTGTGVIMLSLLAEQAAATGVGVDLSAAALLVARQNSGDLGLNDRANFCQSNWFENVTGQFDLIVSNPPYVTADEYASLDAGVREWEPKMALTPGGDGLEPYRIIAAQAGHYLNIGGRLIVEIGPTQGGQVAKMFADSALTQIEIRTDFDGRDRVVLATKSM